jgi:hypothetical protein
VTFKEKADRDPFKMEDEARAYFRHLAKLCGLGLASLGLCILLRRPDGQLVKIPV